MMRIELENALANQQFENWIAEYAQDFIIGGKHFPRERKICDALARLTPDNIVSERGGRRDFYDRNNRDTVGENAHNGTYQPAAFGPEHLILRFNEYVNQGLTGHYFGVMSLLDMIQIQDNTAFADSYRNGLRTCTPDDVQAILNQFPGGIVFQTQTQVLHSPEEPNTTFKYHFYLVSLQLSVENAIALRNTFGHYDWFKRVQFNNEWLQVPA